MASAGKGKGMGMGMGCGGKGCMGQGSCMGGKGFGMGMGGCGMMMAVDNDGFAIPRDAACGKDDKGKGKATKSKKGNVVVEGARMQGTLKSLTAEHGFVKCPHIPTE